MAQDTAGSIRSRAIAHPERLALAAARAAPASANAARTELVHQVHLGARLAEQGPEALSLDRLLELAVLALLEVADRDDGLLGPAEQLLEPCEQTGLGDLAPHVAAELERLSFRKMYAL